MQFTACPSADRSCLDSVCVYELCVRVRL
ncbi:hypothetical protein M6B38_327565 [Iris pallida]|uniref:Uncharacterized protein n=1 Tax=Iris pallida TaxID=29817 RepID=A0AAX6G3A1_IRIPA|nr:hypothetical protein M6B38_384520 [Iris pallida]KAJ6836315.1 hypothetical protein M6B38_327565 [Iris pallida]